MKITIKIEGTRGPREEKLDAVLDVPDNWKPSFEDFCAARGCCRWLIDKLTQEFEPDQSEN